MARAMLCLVLIAGNLGLPCLVDLVAFDVRALALVWDPEVVSMRVIVVARRRHLCTM